MPGAIELTSDVAGLGDDGEGDHDADDRAEQAEVGAALAMPMVRKTSRLVRRLRPRATRPPTTR